MLKPHGKTHLYTQREKLEGIHQIASQRCLWAGGFWMVWVFFFLPFWIYVIYNTHVSSVIRKKGSEVTLKEAWETQSSPLLDQGLHSKETVHPAFLFEHFHHHSLISFSQSPQEAGRVGIPCVFREENMIFSKVPFEWSVCFIFRNPHLIHTSDLHPKIRWYSEPCSR